MTDQIQAVHTFPPGFLWGTATAAHQVEGGNHNSWSEWEQTPGRIFQNQRSGAACGWWEGRAEEDFDRAAALNNNALRLSVEWSRVEPEPGRWDEHALARYREMILALRARGLEPMVTLHHFANPVWLEERGSWANAETPALFARYAVKVVEALGDQVTLWCTINEPMVYAAYGFLLGYWPPGHTSLDETFAVIANLAQGHAEAYHAIKQASPTAQVGFAKHQISFRADNPAGWVGARTLHWLFNEMIFGPFLSGKLRLPLRRAVRLPKAQGALDWVGLQYYHRQTVRLNLKRPEMFFFEQSVREDVPHGPQPQWGEFAPEETFRRIDHLWKLTRLPIYVTEVGVPDPDDTIRPGYLARTVRSVWDARVGNLPVKGMFWWSLVDNFEWAEGYDPRFRFGLYGVDFANGERTLHRSGELYRAICGANALSADMVRQHAPEVLSALFPEPRTQ